MKCVRVMVRVSLMIVPIAVISCASTAQSPVRGAVTDTLIVATQFLNAEGHPESANERPRNPSLVLGVIPGAIAGSPTRTIQADRISQLSEVSIHLQPFAAAAANQATPMSAEAANSGLVIEPADTRLARASTGFDWTGERHSFHTKFVDSDDSTKTLTLVYFDRPCRLTGKIPISRNGGERTIVYDVTIKNPGLNWLVSTRSESNDSTMRAAPDSSVPVLVIATEH